MIPIAARIWKWLHLPTSWQLGIMNILQDQFLIGVTGIIFNDKNEILLFKHTYRNYEWSLPGGYIKAREHPKEGLEREIKEESGYIVSISARHKIRTDRDAARLDIVYIGKFIGGDFRPSGEVKSAEFFTFDNMPQISRDQLVLIDKVMNSRKTTYKN